MDGTFCALASLEAQEGLAGTAAADTDLWLVLEYDGAWAPKPLPASQLPGAVKDRIGRWLDENARARLQLIRRPGRIGAGPTLFLGYSGERAPWLLRFELSGYDALLDLDLDAVFRDGGHRDAERVVEPLHLVCTHGKRDRCCTKWGRPVYQALAAVDPEHTWHTTHLGGHRFAANVLLLPHGLSYGRVEATEVDAMREAHRAGRLFDVGRLRGRTCYAPQVQAAECFMRDDTGFGALGGQRLAGVEELALDRWRVRFALPDGREHGAEVVREETGASAPASCGDAPRPAARLRRA